MCLNGARILIALYAIIIQIIYNNNDYNMLVLAKKKELSSARAKRGIYNNV